MAYFNRYVYAFNDPVSFTDPTGMCGTRRDDGTCEVTIDADIADFELARNAASALENQLNALDPMVNALSDDAQLQWTDSNNSTHTISGAEFKHAWNNTSWNVGSRPPDNGGVGEAFPGGVNITAAGLAGYVRWGEAGLNYLVFHDVGGHLTPPGLAMQALQWGNFVSANPNLTRDELNANYPSSSYYVANERFANQAALTIANRLNVPILGNPAHGY